MTLISRSARYALPLLFALVIVACSPRQPATPTTSILSELPTPATLPSRATLPTSASTDAASGEATIDTASLPSTRLPSAYVVVSNAQLVDMPGGAVLANLSAGERVGIVALSADSQWLLVRYQPLEPTLPEREGWLLHTDVTAFTNIDDLPVARAELAPEATPTASETDVTPEANAAVAIVTTDRLNLRVGPGTDQRAVGALNRDEEVQLIGRSDDSVWLQVRTAQGKEGWAAARFLRTAANIADLPVAGVATTSVPASQPAASTSASNASGDGVIVFQTSNGGDIYVINANGTGLRRLTAGIDPALSPDGRQVAFTRVGGDQGLWVINTDGSGERRLISAKVPRSPSWTPDGSAIVFERNTIDKICRNTPLGCYTDEQIRDAFGGKDCMAFPIGTFCIEDFEKINRKFTGLVRYDIAGGTLTDLPGPEIAQAPSLSPIGDQVIFLFREGLAQTSDQGSENPQLLVAFPFLGPATYSPDGRFIYGSQLSGDHWDIWRWNADGSNPVALTAPPAIRDRPIHNVAPTVSPDGKTILFLTDRNNRWELWQMSTDGSAQRPFAAEALPNIAFQYQFGNERVVSWR